MKILCVGWNLSREELETLTRTAAYIESELEGPVVLVTDAYRHTLTSYDEYITFGKQAAETIAENESNFWKMMSVKELKTKRVSAMKDLSSIIRDIKLKIKTEEVKSSVHVEKEEITIGKTECDIHISEKEVEYLQGLKKLLGGCKMIISKGDLKIEVE